MANGELAEAEEADAEFEARSSAPRGEGPAEGLSEAQARLLREPGEHVVGSDVVCQITRFGLRCPIDLARAYLHFRRTRRQAKRVPGFIGAAFVVEGPWTCYTISLWRDPAAIARFGTSAPEHLRAARDLIGRVRFQPDRGPELWSTKWRLWTVSSNLNWGPVDLRRWLERTARTVDGR